MKFIHCIILAAFLSSCGQQVAPTGGPRDSIPPKLVAALPEYGAKNFKGNKITLVFDEYITLDNPYEKLTYSPTPKINPNAEGKLKTITVKLKDTLEENTTYSIDFGEAIKDINENNILKDFTYTFSTGAYIDSAYLTGKVIIAETGKVDSTMIAVLHQQMDDSAVAKQKPRYYTRLKGDGSFLFRNIRPGLYNVFAIKDADGGKKYDQSSELIAFLNSPISIGIDTSTLLYAFEEEQEIKPAPKSTTKPAANNKKGEDKRLKFSNNLEGERLDLLSNLILTTEHPLKKLDSSKIRFTDKEFKSITGFTLDKDSTGKQLIIKHPWTENTAYNLILEKDFALDTMDNKFMKTDTIGFTSKKESDYGSIDIKIANIDSNLHPILLLLKENKIVLQQQAKQEKYKIKLFNPGEYQISILFDINNNGKWDTGNYWKKRQPEKVVARKQTLQIRANWDNELRIDLKDIQ
ncbi:MAG: Ig-like domain-containing protein [Chitinophagaceae bacterium]|nr:Ig-like domain-containing protein [Chitinophagaceae bacterium]